MTTKQDLLVTALKIISAVKPDAEFHAAIVRAASLQLEAANKARYIATQNREIV